MKTTTKRYSEAIQFKTLKERFEYLKLPGTIGYTTFGCHRHLNQALYTSPEWRKLRREIILRDNGCNLALEDYPIGSGNILIHHLNPITIDDVMQRRDCVFDPENLICCSFKVHNALHYGSFDGIDQTLIVRTPNDTCPWKIGGNGNELKVQV